MNTMNHKEYDRDERTICEQCQNACGKCLWSALALPVKGWVAEPTIILRHHGHGYNSFRVVSCPMFVKDDKEGYTQTIATDRVKPFCFGILLSAVRDYAHYLIKIDTAKKAKKHTSALNSISYYAKREEMWFYSPLAIDICDICGIHADPEQIVKSVRADPLGVVERLKKNYSPVGEIEDEYTED